MDKSSGVVSSSRSLEEKLEAAKNQLSTLKKSIRALKTEKANGNIKQVKEKSNASGDGKKSNISLVIKKNLVGHFGKVICVDTFRNAERLVSASQDGKLFVWNGYSGFKLESIALPSAWVLSLSIEQEEGLRVASGGLDNICSVIPLGHPTLEGHKGSVCRMAGHRGYISSCSFINSGQVLTTSGDRTNCIWDLSKPLKPILTFRGHSADVLCSSFTESNPNVFITGSCDSTAKVWDIRTGACTQTFFSHEADINSIEFFPDGVAFGTGSDDSSCRLLDIRCYGELATFSNPKISCAATSVSFSKSGQLLFAGYDDYVCRAWSVIDPSDSPSFQLYGHENRIASVHVSRDGRCLCTGSWDSTIKRKKKEENV